MKIAPIHRLMLASDKLEPILIHTGQHYDKDMSKIFFEDLDLPKPHFYLGVGSGTHAQQTAAIMIKLEKTIVELKPGLVLVVGDVNSTLAASIVASKLHIPIAHVEAGLRSFDRTMPEEINRTLTDAVADFLFITEESGRKNLLNEGIKPQKIHFVGNVMIDSLLFNKTKAEQSTIIEDLNLNSEQFVLLTLHRPSNVDLQENFEKIIDVINNIQEKNIVIFPIHPRTKKMIKQFNMETRIQQMKNFRLIEPLGYLDFLKLMSHSFFVLTDSGGIQEETTVLSIPCITLRKNTERPATIELGTNVLVGMNPNRIIEESYKIMDGKAKQGQIPPLWDGKAAARIVSVLEKNLHLN